MSIRLQRAAKSLTVGLLLAIVAANEARAQAHTRTGAPPSPSAFLGIEVGADRVLADYQQIRRYFDALAGAAAGVQLEVLGETTLGKQMFLVAISSPENITHLAQIKETARRLADPRGLAPNEASRLIAEGKVVLLVTCNIHSTEIAASQMAMEWAYQLAATNDAETQRRLQEVVVLLVPSLNPDGQTLVTEWYRKNLGTPYEGGRMPWLYHHYVGHDNNRDFLMLTQKETRVITRAVVKDWFPQVWLDEHQMGSLGPRIFVPPFTNPVSERINPLIWREVNLIGSMMALRLEQAGKAGVIYDFSYDAYWPGGTMNTAWWKNISGLLTEVASARIASPITIDPSELRGGRKGLVEYGPQTNFPNPWRGGTWRMRDIIDYEIIASNALLETAANHRRDILRDATARAHAAIDSFQPGQAWRIAAEQHDLPSATRLALLMQEHGAEVNVAENGDVIIPLNQPYGPFVQEMFETQRYPEVKLVAGSDIVEPYDVSTWSLPLMLGVAAERVERFDGRLAPFQPPPLDLPLQGDSFVLARRSPEDARLLSAALRSGGVRVATVGIRAGGRQWPAGVAVLDRKAARAASVVGVPGQSWTALAGDSFPAQALHQITAPRVGLYKSWSASMDEGWTRFLLDGYGFEPTSLDDKTIQAGGLRNHFDAIVLPDLDKDTLATGRRGGRDSEGYREELPEEYRGGLDKTGAEALVAFVEEGGTLVALASSIDYVIAQFNVPVKNSLAGASRREFASAGALLRLEVTPGHQVTAGLPATVAAFVDEPMVLETTPPGPDVERVILARYPRDRRDILLSGWVQGEDRLAGRAAAVAVRYGKGKIVLLAFRPQHRAQTPGTFPFLFNSLFWSVQ